MLGGGRLGGLEAKKYDLVVSTSDFGSSGELRGWGV